MPGGGADGDQLAVGADLYERRAHVTDPAQRFERDEPGMPNHDDARELAHRPVEAPSLPLPETDQSPESTMSPPAAPHHTSIEHPTRTPHPATGPAYLRVGR